MNASCFHILFVAGLWGREGNTRFFPTGTTHMCTGVRKPCGGLSSSAGEVGAHGMLEQYYRVNQRRPRPPLSGLTLVGSVCRTAGLGFRK